VGSIKQIRMIDPKFRVEEIVEDPTVLPTVVGGIVDAATALSVQRDASDNQRLYDCHRSPPPPNSEPTMIEMSTLDVSF
jgi:hypothetical protein